MTPHTANSDSSLWRFTTPGIPRMLAMFCQHPGCRKLVERKKLESELESAYKSKLAVWDVVFMALVLGMALAMAILMRWWSKGEADRESTLVHPLEVLRAHTTVATEASVLAEAQERKVGAFPGLP